jgi:hypothetical protein
MGDNAEGTRISQLDYMSLAQAMSEKAVFPVAIASAANHKIRLEEIDALITSKINIALDGCAELEDLEALRVRIDQLQIQVDSKQDKLIGDPMQLVKGDGTFTSGFADVRSVLDGDYSSAPEFPDVSCYMIFTSQDKLKTWVLIANQCEPTPQMYIIQGFRDNTSQPFNFNSEWRRVIDDIHLKSELSKLSDWITYQPFGSQYIPPGSILLRVNKNLKIAELLIIDLPNRPGTSIGYIPAEYNPKTTIQFFVTSGTNTNHANEYRAAFLTRDGLLIIDVKPGVTQSGSCMWSYW